MKIGCSDQRTEYAPFTRASALSQPGWVLLTPAFFYLLLDYVFYISYIHHQCYLTFSPITCIIPSYLRACCFGSSFTREYRLGIDAGPTGIATYLHCSLTTVGARKTFCCSRRSGMSWTWAPHGGARKDRLGLALLFWLCGAIWVFLLSVWGLWLICQSPIVSRSLYSYLPH